MLNKRFIFKIDVSDFNIRTGYSSYTVLKVCDETDVIQSMVRDSDVHQVLTISFVVKFFYYPILIL